MKTLIENWDWEHAAGSVVFSAAVLAVIFGTVCMFQDHRVDGYYVHAETHQVCAYAHWTWHPDESAYCSDDVQRVLAFIKEANAGIR